jgi:hypothetical protein
MSAAEIFRIYLQRFTSGDTAGRLASARLIFDTAAMAALMPGS